MKNCTEQPIYITGLGVIAAIGQGKEKFLQQLLAGDNRFAAMQRPGRQLPLAEQTAENIFLGAEIADFLLPTDIEQPRLRTASLSAKLAIATLHEAWHEAQLDHVDPTRISLVVGGSNVQQRELVLMQQSYRDKSAFLKPTYAMSFLDSDICGLCSEQFKIRGRGYTVGGASASGQLALIHAIETVKSGQADVCIALGAMMDLSYWECQAFTAIGAMGSNRFRQQPALACRPFDQDRDGFIFGEMCGAIVVESAASAQRLQATPYAQVAGWAMQLDGNRNPNPSVAGEAKVIADTLKHAGFAAADIDYINPHGTASPLGDETELQALRVNKLQHAYINSTKSLIGHGLSAAGCVEMVALLLQMKQGMLHPCRNLAHSIDPSFQWTGPQSVAHRMRRALNISIGFGGVNTAVCVQTPD